MAICEVCGNDYDKMFEVMTSGNRHVFDGLAARRSTFSRRCASTAAAGSSGSGASWSARRGRSDDGDRGIEVGNGVEDGPAMAGDFPPACVA